MSDTLGTIRGQMILDVQKALRAYTAVRQEHVSTVTALSTGGGAIAASGAMIAGAGIAMGAGLLSAVNAAAEFERKLDYFVAVAGPAAADRYDEVSAKALQIGQDTIYSADQIADSFVELAKAGVGVEDLLAGIGEGVANLGAAADMPLIDAAMGLTTVLNTFGLEARDAIHVTDVLSGAANASTISVQDLILTLTYAGASAKVAGISFEDMSSAIALLGERGIRGSKAGTGLRQMLTKLVAPTNKGKDALRELGIIAEDGSNSLKNLDGTLKPLPQVMDTLNAALDGMTQDEKINILNKIFPITSLPSILNLLDGGSEALERLNKEIGKTTAADVAAARLDNLSGDVEILRGNLETLAVTAGSGFQGFARGIVQGVTSIVQAFMDLSPGVQMAILTTIAVTSALLILIGTTGILAGSILQLIQLWIRMAPAMTALIGIIGKLATAVKLLWLAFIPGWVGPVLIALTLVAAALSYFFTQTEQGQAVWAQLTGMIQQAVATILPIITQLAGQFGTFLVSALQTLMPLLAALGQFLMGVLAPVLAIIMPALQGVAQAFSNVGSNASGMAALGDIFSDVMAGILQSIPLIVNAVVQLLILIVSTIANYLPQLVTAGITLITGLLTGLLAALPMIIQAVVTLITTLITQLVAMIPMLVQGALQLFQGLIQALGLIIPVLIAAVIELILALVTALLTAIPLLIDAAINLFMALVDALPVIIPLLLQAVVQLITGVIEATIAAIPILLEAAIQLFMALLEALVEIIPMVITTTIELIPTIIAALISLIPILLNGAIRLFMALVDALPKILPKLITAVINLIPKIISTLIGLIPQLIQAAIQLFMAIVQAVPRIVPPLVNALVSLGTQMIQGLVRGITNMASAAVNAVKNVVDGAIGWAKNLLGIASPSKVFAEIGVNTMLGLIKGIHNERRALTHELASVADEMATFYSTVGAAAELDTSLNLATSGVDLTSTSLATQLQILSDQLRDIAEQDRITIEKQEINNPVGETTEESTANGIRKAAYLVG